MIIRYDRKTIIIEREVNNLLRELKRLFPLHFGEHFLPLHFGENVPGKLLPRHFVNVSFFSRLLLLLNRFPGAAGAAAATRGGGGDGVVLLRRVGQQMLFEMRLLGESLGAHLALMRLFSRVNLLVTLEIGLSTKAFVALAADVGGAVGEQMLFQVAALGEGFHADGAFVRPFAGMNLLVALKIRLVAETFVARRACEGSVGAPLPFTSAAATRRFNTAAGAATTRRRRSGRRRDRRRRRDRSLFPRDNFIVDFDGRSGRRGFGGGGGGRGGEIVVVLARREDHRRGIERNVCRVRL